VIRQWVVGERVRNRGRKNRGRKNRMEKEEMEKKWKE